MNLYSPLGSWHLQITYDDPWLEYKIGSQMSTCFPHFFSILQGEIATV
jgi:hypothetical protein